MTRDDYLAARRDEQRHIPPRALDRFVLKGITPPRRSDAPGAPARSRRVPF